MGDQTQDGQRDLLDEGKAEDIVERFGGIRPMAHVLDIPATTVQGWKSRGSIPKSRFGAIREAAAKANISLALGDAAPAAAPETAPASAKQDLPAEPKAEPDTAPSETTAEARKSDEGSTEPEEKAEAAPSGSAGPWQKPAQDCSTCTARI